VYRPRARAAPDGPLCPPQRTRRPVPGGMSPFVDTPTTRCATSSPRGSLGDVD
jgi:hypothetical protein